MTQETLDEANALVALKTQYENEKEVLADITTANKISLYYTNPETSKEVQFVTTNPTIASNFLNSYKLFLDAEIERIEGELEDL